MRNFLTSMALLLILFTVGCSKNSKSTADNSKATAATESKIANSSNGKLTLLFFMNPLGSPCQMQDQVITSMGSQLTDNADVKYIRTTEMETARAMFQKYGIRALPSLIMLNIDGSVRHRFSPGIISPNDILETIN